MHFLIRWLGPKYELTFGTNQNTRNAIFGVKNLIRPLIFHIVTLLWNILFPLILFSQSSTHFCVIQIWKSSMRRAWFKKKNCTDSRWVKHILWSVTCRYLLIKNVYFIYSHRQEQTSIEASYARSINLIFSGLSGTHNSLDFIPTGASWYSRTNRCTSWKWSHISLNKILQNN